MYVLFALAAISADCQTHTKLKISMQKRTIVLFFILVVLLSGCNNIKQRQLFPAEPVEVEVNIIRFDSALLAVRTTDVKQDVDSLYARYHDFTALWVNSVLYSYLGFLEDAGFIKMYADSAVQYQLPVFLHDNYTGLEQANYDTKEVFADITPIKKSLNLAYGRWLTIEPQHYVPNIYFMLSAFFYPLISIGQDMALGTECYLGSDYPFYDKVVYNYQKQTMRPECIPVNIVLQDMKQTYPMNFSQSRLIDEMIYQGIIMYATAALFPELPKYEIIGYPEQKWKWCEQYEADLWKTMMDRQVLFSQDPAVQASFLSDGPFTSEISQDSPARLGTWLGWRIVEQYMNTNTEVSLLQLLGSNDAQQILEQSKYRP